MKALAILLALSIVAAAADPRPAWLVPKTPAEQARYDAAWRANLEAGRLAREQAEREAAQQQQSALLWLILQQGRR